MLLSSQSYLKNAPEKAVSGSRQQQGKDGLKQLPVSSKLQKVFCTGSTHHAQTAVTTFKKAKLELLPAQLMPKSSRGDLWQSQLHAVVPSYDSVTSLSSRECVICQTSKMLPQLLAADRPALGLIALTHGWDILVGLQTCLFLWTSQEICSLG